MRRWQGSARGIGLGMAMLLLLATPLAAREAVDRRSLDAYLETLERDNGAVGSVSILQDGVSVYRRDFGQAHLAGVRADADTPYQVASVTKMVTAIAAFQLIESGRLHLDERLVAFFPDMPAADTITVSHLLGHTSGLGNFAIKDGVVWVVDAQLPADILNEIKRQGIAFTPGERVAYSNSAYYLLRMIIERVRGAEYATIVEQDIARPLGLKHVTAAGATPSTAFRSYTYDGQWSQIKDIDYANVVGVGDIASTSHDLALLITGLFQHRLVSAASLERMLPIAGNGGWGQGLAEFRYGDTLYYGHGGDVLGSHARVIYNPATSLAIAYTTNGEQVPTNTVLERLVGFVHAKHAPTSPQR